MITCKIIVDFKLSMIKMQIKGWFRAYFCMLSPSIVTKAFPGISLIVSGHFYWFGWIYVRIGLGSVSLGGVERLRGSFKEVYF